MNKYLRSLAPYIGLMQEVKKELRIIDNKPVKFNPDNINTNHKVIPKNHKKFVIEGIEIYALSEKRAKEKFKKLQNELGRS